MKTPTVLGTIVFLIVTGLVRVDLVAQEPKVEPARERSVHRGPNHILFPIRTELQGRLIPDPDHADTYLFLNGPGLISNGAVNKAALKVILLHVTRHQARAAKVVESRCGAVV